MTGINLSEQDYCRVLKFLDRIQSVEPEVYRKQVLVSLANIFNFDLTTFWLADNNGNMVDPVTLSVDKKIMESFQNYYYQYDPFYPKNLPKSLVNKSVITINDLTTQEEYRKNKYFKDVLNHHKLSHKIMYVYRDNGKLLGASTFLRPASCKDFSSRDIALIETCLRYVSKSLSHIFLLKDLNFQKFLFESLCNNSDTGIFILNQHSKVTYSNSAAIDYTRALIGNKQFENPTYSFIGKYLSSNNLWKHGLTTTLRSDDGKSFSIRIISQIQRSENQQYLVFIQPIYHAHDTQPSNRNDIANKLTLREREVLNEVLKGRSNQEISANLFISIATVKSHLQSIFGKCNVSNRTKLCYKFNAPNSLL
jgi:DNA-binding CsgD family transcriptional regulator